MTNKNEPWALWTNLVHMVHKVQNVDQFWSTKFSFYRRFIISRFTVSTLRFSPSIVLIVESDWLLICFYCITTTL